MRSTRKDAIIHAAIPTRTKQELANLAKRLGVSVSAVIRTIVERYLMEQR